jgi:hypothetical protein
MGSGVYVFCTYSIAVEANIVDMVETNLVDTVETV